MTSIFHMHIPYDEAFLFIPKVLTLQPWPWPSTYMSEIFNIYLNFWTIRGWAFIFNMYIPCDDAFPFIPKFLTCVTLTVNFDLHIWKRETEKESISRGGHNSLNLHFFLHQILFYSQFTTQQQCCTIWTSRITYTTDFLIQLREYDITYCDI